MKNRLKIKWVFLFFLASFTGRSQTEEGLLPYSNRLHLNPSYAGINKNTSTWSSLQFSSQPENELNHAFTLTHDRWSEKMKSGMAFYFYQGLAGKMNTNTTGAGFTFSKPIEIRKSGQIIPSFNINYRVATKQWFVNAIDGVLDKQLEPPSPPGEDFRRYNLVRPRAGLLWHSPYTELGFSAVYSNWENLVPDDELPEQAPFHLIFHFARKMKGKKKGLVSQPFRASPEVVILYAENMFRSRAGFRMEQTEHLFGLFLENNYTDNIHGIGGILGWKFQHFKLNFAAGGAYSVPTQQPAFFGEVSLGLVVPYIHFDEKNPWAPPKKSF